MGCSGDEIPLSESRKRVLTSLNVQDKNTRASRRPSNIPRWAGPSPTLLPWPLADLTVHLPTTSAKVAERSRRAFQDAHQLSLLRFPVSPHLTESAVAEKNSRNLKPATPALASTCDASNLESQCTFLVVVKSVLADMLPHLACSGLNQIYMDNTQDNSDADAALPNIFRPSSVTD